VYDPGNRQVAAAASHQQPEGSKELGVGPEKAAGRSPGSRIYGNAPGWSHNERARSAAGGAQEMGASCHANRPSEGGFAASDGIAGQRGPAARRATR